MGSFIMLLLFGAALADCNTSNQSTRCKTCGGCGWYEGEAYGNYGDKRRRVHCKSCDGTGRPKA